MTEKLIKVAWVDNYHDGPVSGHAWCRKQYCYFRQEDEDTFWLFGLDFDQMMGALATRKLYEDLVSYSHTHYATGRVVGQVVGAEFAKNSHELFRKNEKNLWRFSEHAEGVERLGLFHRSYFQFYEEVVKLGA